MAGSMPRHRNAGERSIAEEIVFSVRFDAIVAEVVLSRQEGVRRLALGGRPCLPFPPRTIQRAFGMWALPPT